MSIRRKKLGLGDAKSPTSSCPCIYRAELALTYATYPEPMPTKVGTHQRLATRYDNQHLMRINMRSDGLVNHTEEVLGRHVGCYFATAAITTTMQAMDIAAERGLPKELLQWVQLLKVLAAKPLKLEYDAFAEVHEGDYLRQLATIKMSINVNFVLVNKNTGYALQKYGDCVAV